MMQNDLATCQEIDAELTRECSGDVRGRVYFIMGDEAIKIGYSIDPVKRLNELQVGSSYPLILLGVIDGTKELESDLHEHFRDIRMMREWFFPAHELLDFINHAMGRPIVQKEEPYQPKSPASPEVTAMIRLRDEKGHDTPIGHRCSNLAEMIPTYQAATDPHQRANLARDINIQTTDLARLLAT